VKEYCGCSICEENENQGGQRKDRSEIKGRGLGKISDHGRVYEGGKIIGWSNSLTSRWICCRQPGGDRDEPMGVFKHLERTRTPQHMLYTQPSRQGCNVLRGLGIVL
jgi:hypothetical protein